MSLNTGGLEGQGGREGGRDRPRPALAGEAQGRGRAAGAARPEFPGEGSSSPSPGECGNTRAPSPRHEHCQPVTRHSAQVPSQERGSLGGRTLDFLPQGMGRLSFPPPPALLAGWVPVLVLIHPFKEYYLLITPYLAHRVHSRGSSPCPELLPRPPLAGDAAPRLPFPTQTLLCCREQTLGLTPVLWIPSQSPGFPNLGDSAPGRCYGRHFHSVPGGQRGCRSSVAGQHGERPQPGVS